jgi:hypothetical protein
MTTIPTTVPKSDCSLKASSTYTYSHFLYLASRNNSLWQEQLLSKLLNQHPKSDPEIVLRLLKLKGTAQN